ncbi:pentapeptide repeat-containing protein [Culturomica massiliensis]|uniref:pentapeptide repeat-containing protein n=1 Tax=Culturomica massiliensis TaxID=1841857 RepID=UPI003AB84CFC
MATSIWRQHFMNKKAYLAILTLAATASQLLYADNENYDATRVTRDFINMSLVDSSWYRANASGVKFTGSNLTNANFGAATLTGTDFTDTNLTGVNFNSAVLTNAIFTDSTITNVNFSSTNFTAAQLYSTASYKEKNISGINFDGNNLSGWNFKDQNLDGSRFFNATLTGADFTGAKISGTILSAAVAKGFTVDNLYSTASYANKDLHGINLSNNNLSGWNFKDQNLDGANFYGSTLTGTNFTGAKIKGAVLEGAVAKGFTVDSFYSTASYNTDKNFGAINLSQNDLSGWDFKNSNLDGGKFSNSTLTGADFTGARIKGAVLSNTVSKGFTSAQLYSTASYSVDKDLGAINLSQNDLSGWSFKDQNLTNANFQSATLAGANFSGAEIRGADFANATGFTSEMLCSTASYANKDLSGVFFTRITIDGVDFEGVNLSNANFQYCTISNVDFTNTATPNFNLSLYYSTISNVNFAGMNLDNGNYATIYGLTYGEGVNFTDTILPRVYIGQIPKEVLEQTWNYKSGTLELVLSNNERIDGLNLEGYRVHCDFSNSSLKNINFKDADLTGSDFGQTDLSGADFTDATINNVYLDRSNFTSQQLESTKSYKQKDLSGVDMTRLNISFEGKDLSGFNFSNADLERINLKNAIFEDAIINDTRFYGSSIEQEITLAQIMQTKSYKYKDLSGASFHYTIFENADFSGFNMQRTMFGSSASNLFTNVNFTNADLRGAGYTAGRNGWDTATFKNTILKDGTITALEMDSPDDYILVREYKYTDSFGTIYATFAEDASISGGATLMLDNMANLMIDSDVSVYIEDGGIVSYNMDVSNKEAESYIYLPSGGDLNFAEGSTLNINVDGDLEAYTDYYKYILYADNISTLYDVYNDILMLYENGDVYFSNNGEEFNGHWEFFRDGNWIAMYYYATVPEPAACAAILGVLALAFAVRRRRK